MLKKKQCPAPTKEKNTATLFPRELINLLYHFLSGKSSERNERSERKKKHEHNHNQRTRTHN